MSDTKASKVDRILRQIVEVKDILPELMELRETTGVMKARVANLLMDKELLELQMKELRQDRETLKRYLKNQIEKRVTVEKKYSDLCVQIIEGARPK